MTINTSAVDHHREAQRLTEGAYDHYADSMRAGLPPGDRAEAGRACRLITGLSFAHGLLAVADAVRHVAGPAMVDATLDSVVNAAPPAKAFGDPVPEDPFMTELKELVNRHSKENGSNTPDHVLAQYLVHCLEAFDYATRYRDQVHDRASRGQIIAAHLERMAERYPAAVFAEDGHAPDAVAGTALRTVLLAEAVRLRGDAS